MAYCEQALVGERYAEAEAAVDQRSRRDLAASAIDGFIPDKHVHVHLIGDGVGESGFERQPRRSGILEGRELRTPKDIFEVVLEEVYKVDVV